ncbi:acyl carrier protein [Kitasatospora sp. NPDC101235]|uniref:acyl carrier protein n=1 Tax=Kitasatospora sp. NPDC101235 TaxID=3364101 RepID=UPI0037F2B754
MTEITVDDLRRIMREGVGEREGFLDGDILDLGFAELDIDSLALLETATRIEREFDVNLPDSLVTEAATVGGLLAMVNEALAAQAG